MIGEPTSEESDLPDDAYLPDGIYVIKRVVVEREDGLEFTIVFPQTRPARYRIRRNRMMDGRGKVTSEFREHEVFWSEGL